MLIKWTGEQPEITIRNVTFEKNKPVKVEDAGLITKLLGIPGFEEAKATRRAKNAKDLA